MHHLAQACLRRSLHTEWFRQNGVRSTAKDLSEVHDPLASDHYPLSPLQHGMLFHYVQSGRHTGVDIEQLEIALPEDLDLRQPDPGVATGCGAASDSAHAISLGRRRRPAPGGPRDRRCARGCTRLVSPSGLRADRSHRRVPDDRSPARLRPEHRAAVARHGLPSRRAPYVPRVDLLPRPPRLLLRRGGARSPFRLSTSARRGDADRSRRVPRTGTTCSGWTRISGSARPTRRRSGADVWPASQRRPASTLSDCRPSVESHRPGTTRCGSV